jgi:putative photosynthetic complex assembly protein 2
MNDALSPIAFAVFSWWIGTGLVFIAERAVRGRTQAALSVIFAAGMLSLFGVVQSSGSTQPAGAYLAFASSIGLWGALELSFLTGLVTGPRLEPTTRNSSGTRRFGQAIMALLYHELALIAFGVLVVAVCWNQPNPTAACTYTLLWIMRESAKLNLFLGVRNSAVELLPHRLAHLGSYFGKRKVNLLLPVSIVAATIADVALVRHALSISATPQENVGALLLATLLALAILEHIVLVLPIRADALWIWATRRNGKAEPPADGRAAQRRRSETDVVATRGAPAVL